MFNYKNAKKGEGAKKGGLRYQLSELQAFGSAHRQLPANLKVSSYETQHQSRRLWSKITKKSVDIVETLHAEEFKPSKTVLRFPASTPMFQHGQGTGFGLKSASSLSD